jgi:hypothetical protein
VANGLGDPADVSPAGYLARRGVDGETAAWLLPAKRLSQGEGGGGRETESEVLIRL